MDQPTQLMLGRPRIPTHPQVGRRKTIGARESWDVSASETPRSPLDAPATVRLWSRMLRLLAYWGITLMVAHTAAAEDWPQWRGPDRTGRIAAGSRTPTELSEQPKRVWKHPAGEGFASPVVADSRVYLFDNQGGKETLRALAIADGTELWRASVDETFRDEQGPPGPRCTPLVDSERVYAQSGLGELQCLDVRDGHLKWRVNFRKDFGSPFLGEDSPIPGAAEHGYTASPVIDGPRLIALVGSTNGAGVVAFDKKTGTVLWKSLRDLAAYAPPLVTSLAGSSQCLAFTVDGLVGLRPEDGTELWRSPLKTSYGRHCTTPIVSGDWVYAGSYKVGLIATHLTRSGTQLTATRAWTNASVSMNFSSPVLVGRHLYALGTDRNLVCVEADSGRIAWSKEGFLTRSADVAHAGLIGLGDLVFVLKDDGEGVLFAADPTAYRERGRAQLGGLNWCNPAYADGRLYLRDGVKGTGSLYCYDLLPNR